jgi:AcrR family transcriptional regulator
METISRKEKEKLARKEDILNAAEKVLASMGYNKASMEEIAKEAQFSRKTVYQYFTDKEDLFFSVLNRVFQRLLNYCTEATKTGTTGFEKLKNLTFAYYNFYQNFPTIMDLMTNVGHIKSNEKNAAKVDVFNNLSKLIVEEIEKAIKEGQSDGSIRSDLDSTYLANSSQFMLTGFFCMISASGKTFTNHFSIDQNDFIKFNLNLLCDAVR